MPEAAIAPHGSDATNATAPGPLFPFLDLQAQFASIEDEVMAAIQRVMRAQHFILGPEVSRFEDEVARFLNAQFAIGCASGSDALLLALLAIGVGFGDEVITTPFTFVATAGAIARTGARPVFVDIETDTYNVSAADIDRAITPRTRAIMPVHLFGLAANMDEILKVAATHNLPVIEDAAQAIGAQYMNRSIGSIGAIGCFSFFPSKNLGGAGDGGMIATNDPELADRLKLLRVHGSRTKYKHEILGVNSRLDALQAAILRVKLRHLSEWTDARRRNVERYRRMFAEAEIGDRVRLPIERPGYHHVYNQYTIAIDERDLLKKHLQSATIPSEIYYPLPLHLQPAFSYLGYSLGDFPAAERAAQQVLSLPIFPELTEDQQNKVVDAIAAFYRTRTYRED